MQRLFLGVAVVVVAKPGEQHNHIIKFVNWKASEDEARGGWTAEALADVPGGRLESIAIHDITDVARAGFING